VIYVFDTSSFSVLKHYYPERFPSLWTGIEELMEAGQLISTREVLNELERLDTAEPLLVWAKDHREIFAIPTNEETEFVVRIFQVSHFQTLINQKSMLVGNPVADPFVIAAAATKDEGAVVTEERFKENAAKIPNVCQHFGIRCMNLEEFMTRQNWNF
jgi:Domain of unknown function (DUF4411)